MPTATIPAKAAAMSVKGTLKNKSGVQDDLAASADEAVRRSFEPGSNVAKSLGVATDKGLEAIEAEKAASSGGVFDTLDGLTNYGFNAQLAVPAAAGAAGWLLQKGEAWGPIFGALPKGLGHILALPQKALKLEVQDVAFHRGSAKHFKAAQKHVASAKRFHTQAAEELAEVHKALKGDRFAGLRETLANTSSGFADVHEEVPLGLSAEQMARVEARGKIFSAEKAGALPTDTIKSSFASGVENLTGAGSSHAAGTAVAEQTLTKSELKALKTAQKHMDRFVENAAKMQEHTGKIDGVRNDAKIAARSESLKKREFLGKAEAKFSAAGEKAENVVKESKPLNAIRNTSVSFFKSRARSHAASAQEIHDVAMERFDKSLAALGDSPKFDKLRSIVAETKAANGKVSSVKNEAGLERLSTKIGDQEKLFAKTVKELKENGALSDAEKTALNDAKKSFSGKFFGFGGAMKKLKSIHGALEGQQVAEMKAAFASDLSASIKKLPKALSKGNLEKAMNPALYWGSQLAVAGHSAKTSITGFSEFKEYVAVVEGKNPKDASSLKAMAQLLYLAEVPKAGKLARSEFWMSVGPKMAGSVGGMIGLHKMFSKGASGRSQAIGMAIQMLGTGVGEMVGGKHQLLETVHTVETAWKKDGRLDAGAYAGMAVQAHKMDMEEVEGNPALKIVSEQYAKANTSPADFLKEITSGAFSKRMVAAKAAVPALLKAEQEKLRTEIKTEAPKLSVADAEMAHLEQRADKANAELAGAAQEKPVMGNFSAKLAGNRNPRAVPVPMTSHAETVQNSADQNPVGATL